MIPSPEQLVKNSASISNSSEDIKKKAEIKDVTPKVLENHPQEAKLKEPEIEQTQHKEPKKTQDHEKVELFEFVSFVHKKHLFGLYHFIMNECQIILFENQSIKIAGEKLEDDIKNQLLSALKEWSQQDWKIAFSTKENFQSLQNDLKLQAKNDESFKTIFSFFPETQISDVWFNFIAK